MLDIRSVKATVKSIIDGIFKKGDKVKVYPSEIEATISAIEVSNKEVDEAFAPQSAVIHLTEDVDISRGSLIAKADNLLKVSNEIEATICWMDERPMNVGGRYLLQHNTRVVNAIVKEIKEKIDVNTLEKFDGVTSVSLNEVVTVKLKTSAPLFYDSYKELRETGSAILIDQTSLVTVAAVLLS